MLNQDGNYTPKPVNQADITKYNTSSKICGHVYRNLCDWIKQGERDIKTLSERGNLLIKTELDKVYKREPNKGIGYPVSISLNNCVGDYIWEAENTEYNTIRSGDIVKIELGVNIGGCIAVLGETFVNNNSDDETVESNRNKRDNQDKANDAIRLLNELSCDVVKMIRKGETTDEVRIYIESKCTENEFFPFENCVSYQHVPIETGGYQLRGEDSKYMVLNHQKYYDDEDTLIVEENLCFDFEEGEVYTINLKIVQDNIEQSNGNKGNEHVYKQPHLPHVYRFNEYFYNLKLKSSREFCKRLRDTHGHNPFVMNDQCQTAKDKMGLRECLDNNLLEYYPVLYNKGGYTVYSKKFTVIITGDKCLSLHYN